MKTLFIVSLICWWAGLGCVSKTKARAQAQAAFSAGLHEGMLRARENAPQPASVVISGPVQNGVVAWRPDLSLAKALLDAKYIGDTDPERIVITRGADRAEIDPQRLLAGEDFKLEPGDRVELE